MAQALRNLLYVTLAREIRSSDGLRVIPAGSVAALTIDPSASVLVLASGGREVSACFSELVGSRLGRAEEAVLAE